VTLIDPADEAGATVDSAQKASERLLADLVDLDGIFTPNESSTTGMLRALQVLQRAGKIKFVGFDSSDVLLKAIETDELQGLVLQDPFDMGYQAVMRALDHLEGMPLPSQRDKSTNLQVLTRENMKQSALKAMYAPDLKKYLGE
jgi:ribose transport system substrate-binding protein